jgi:hypothetical protein
VFKTVVLPLISTLLPLILSVAVAYYGYAQYRLEISRSRWERYDKVYALYRKIVEFISDLSESHNRTHPRSIKFIQETREAEFLAGNKIRDFIYELYRASVKLEHYSRAWKAVEGNTTHPMFRHHLDEIHKQEKWIQEQIPRAKALFMPMLNLASESNQAKESNMSDYNSDIQVELFKASVEAGRNALKAGITINGAASVAMLTFIGSVANSPQASVVIKSLASPLGWFVIGVFLCAFGAGCTYFSQCKFQFGNNKVGYRFMWASIVLVGVSYATFGLGCWTAFKAFSNWP